MGNQTIVFGYVETDPHSDSFNAQVLSDYAYDTMYPFPDIFGTPRRGYVCSLVPFAGSLNWLEHDWETWRAKFEGLLAALHARTARVQLSAESGGDLITLHYLFERAWEPGVWAQPGPREWRRWSQVRDGDEVEETILL